MRKVDGILREPLRPLMLWGPAEADVTLVGWDQLRGLSAKRSPCVR